MNKLDVTKCAECNDPHIWDKNKILNAKKNYFEILAPALCASCEETMRTDAKIEGSHNEHHYYLSGNVDNHLRGKY